MFRHIIAIVLLFACIIKTFNGAVIVLDYYTNTAAFASQCVNKTLPELDCEGKCQMTKKLKEEEKKDEQSPERKVGNDNDVIFRHFFVKCVLYSKDSTSSFPSSFPSSLSVGVCSDIFHPPALV